MQIPVTMLTRYLKFGHFLLAGFCFVLVFSSCTTSKNNAPVTSETKNTLENNNETSEQSVERVKIGNSEIQIVKQKVFNTKPIYFRPHENETTSSTATREIIKIHGGTFIELKSKGERFIEFSLNNKDYSIDPNRIFSTAGIEKTLGGSGDETKPAVGEVSNFVKLLFSGFLTDNKLLIAVHNNTNDGQLSVESYKNNSEAASVFSNPNRDIDDFFYVTDEKYFNFLKEKNFNVVLQDNINVSDDGSLSVYCGKNGISYINVESEHGHLQEQIEMLTVLQEMIKQAE